MRRRWIAVERSASTVADYLVPRLDRVVRGVDPGGATESLAWTGGGTFGVLAIADGEVDERLESRLRTYFATPPDQRDIDRDAVSPPARRQRRARPAEVLSLFDDVDAEVAEEAADVPASGSVVA
jgi:hypothetical protein